MAENTDQGVLALIADGCLPGIGRQLLLEQGVAERSVSIAELREARRIALVSSARGVRRARLLEDPQQPTPKGQP